MLRQLKKMHGVFLEIIIAPSYTDEALEILTTKKKNLRILELPFDAQDASEVEAEYTGVVGGLLVQNQDVVKESPADWQVVTKRQPTETEATALEFALEGYQVCQIKWDHRDQRPHDTWCWPWSNQPCGFSPYCY